MTVIDNKNEIPYLNCKFLLRDNEKLEDLQYKGLKIIQSDDGYRFTTDAVLLANFAKVGKGKRIVELGSGSGVISVLIAAKNNPSVVIGVEIQTALAEMSARTVDYNHLSDVVKIVNCDMNDCDRIIGKGYDAVVCNPPYRKVGAGSMQLSDSLAICRHEVAITLTGVVSAASRLLNTKGSFYLVHQAERLGEIFYELRRNNLEPKELLPVVNRVGDSPTLVLVKAVKGGSVGLKWLENLVIFDENGNYTTTVRRLYGDNV